MDYGKNFCRMHSDSDSYYEEDSDNEQEAVGPLNKNFQVNLEESSESPEAGPLSPVLSPQPVPVGEFSPVWELPDDGTNFINFYTRADVLNLKHWAETTRQRKSEGG